MNTENAIPEGLEILIAEDSLTQSMLLENILEKHGFRVTAARNGRLALDLLKTQRPALVITDIQMPEMDGYELCHGIKSNSELCEIPVILLTSLSAPQDIIRGLESGADNFVVKPYEEFFLLSRIQTIIANQQFRKVAGLETEIPIFFAGKKYVITSDRRQILTLLLSTYETAVKTNQDLIKAHEELKAAQAQLIEAEKLQSVGRLAAGVAHEVRNPLAIIEMGVSFLGDKPMEDDERTILDEMKEAVRRANFVISGLMDLSSPRELGMHAADLNGVLDQALSVFGDQLARGKIDVRKELAPDLSPCRIDSSKIEQVLLNVLSNALDAMPEGGLLEVRTRNKLLEKEDVAFDPGERAGARWREGDRVAIAEIGDSGSGIPEEDLSKLFEPFFSTKPTGKGMGLGLTVAKKIIDVHGGRISMQNRAAGGAEVSITLKCASAASEQQ